VFGACLLLALGRSVDRRRTGVSGMIVYAHSRLRRRIVGSRLRRRIAGRVVSSRMLPCLGSTEVCSSSSKRRSGHQRCEAEHSDPRSQNPIHDESPAARLEHLYLMGCHWVWKRA
jgi:hypothetical protein